MFNTDDKCITNRLECIIATYTDMTLTVNYGHSATNHMSFDSRYSIEEECAVSSCTSTLQTKNMDLHKSLKRLNSVFNKLDTITSLLAAQSKCCPGPNVIKLFSCSTQLSMKLQLLINAEIVKISGKSGSNLKTGNLSCLYMLKCQQSRINFKLS